VKQCLAKDGNPLPLSAISQGDRQSEPAVGRPHDGADLVSEVPHDRFNINNFYDSDPSKTGAVRNRCGGFMDKILSLDAEFFGLFPAHAARIDPQQHLTLEATYMKL